MTISSRTPEGQPHGCPICGKIAALEPSYPGGDSTCPSCGSLLWLFRDRLSKRASVLLDEITWDALLRDDLGVDSLDLVEAIMEVEDEMGITIPDEIASQFRSLRDVIEYLRSCQEGEG